MDFNLETPAMIFPAISLLMLAYTNRFVVLAGLIRELYEEHKVTPKQEILAQIENLQKRMSYIKNMQVLGAIAFILAVVAMLLGMIEYDFESAIVFTLSLVTLVGSLIYLLLELQISITALTIQLDDIKEISEKIE